MDPRHEWSFVASGETIVAVCSRCGVMRRQGTPTTDSQRHIDLRGTCPGVPQEPRGPEMIRPD